MNAPPLPDAEADAPLAIRKMAESDLPAALTLSEDVRWPYRMTDWKALFELGEGRVAQVGDEIVGIGMRWLWGDHGATVGQVVVAPAFRGRKVGSSLVQALCADLDGRTIVLHTPDHVQPLQDQMGFGRLGEVEQYQGKAGQVPLMELPPGCRLRPAGRKDLALLVELDTRASGMPRSRMLKAWLTRAVGAVVLDHVDGAQGFAILRRFGRGAAIGPVVAPCATSAKALIAHLAGAASGRFLHIDVDAGGDLGQWLENVGLSCVGKAAVLGRGEPLATAGGVRTFVLADQALG